MTNTTQQGRTPVWVLTVTDFREEYTLATEVALSEAHAYALAKELIVKWAAKLPRDRKHSRPELLRNVWNSGSVYELIEAWNVLGVNVRMAGTWADNWS